MIWDFLSYPLGQGSQIKREQTSETFLKCTYRTVIACHPSRVGSNSSVWDFSNLLEGQLSWNAVAGDWPRLCPRLSQELHLACTPAAVQAGRGGSGPGSSGRGTSFLQESPPPPGQILMQQDFSVRT